MSNGDVDVGGAEAVLAAGAALSAEAGGGGRRGATVWLTGLPSAGKSTIAAAAAAQLRAEGRDVEVLDGDEVRRNLTSELGFSKEHRDLNVARIGYVAELLARHGVIVFAAVIAPYADAREAVRKRHEQNGTAYAEVYVATPLQVCRSRDVKGLYARQAAGQISGLTGVDDPYEAPRSPELSLHTHTQSVPDSAAELRDLLARMGVA
jgi:adenylylsulfate kinase